MNRTIRLCITALSILAAASAFSQSPCPAPADVPLTVRDTIEPVWFDETDPTDVHSPQSNPKIEFMPLPVGKTLAISSRWDDTNPDHLLMTQTLRSNGWKGTFFLNSLDEKFIQNIARRIIQDGSSIAAHTMSHPSLGQLVPNAQFREIMENRVLLESKLNQCVTGFSFPNGIGGSLTEPENLWEQGEALRRAGIVFAAEYVGTEKRIGLKPSEMVTCYLMRADDSAPQQAVFDKDFFRGLEKLKNGQLKDCGPFFVLGVHSWQKRCGADGFDRLSKIIATQSHNPAYWYCNENEYAAYRLTYLNSQVEAAGREGQYIVKRPSPARLGAEVPLGMKISPAPIFVLVNGQRIDVNQNGEFMLPIENNLPEQIGRTDSSARQSDKFPGLIFDCQFNSDANTISVRIKNDAPEALERISYAFRLPLKWKSGVIESPESGLPRTLALGGEYKAQLPLGERNEAEIYNAAPLYLVGQLDFRFGTPNGKYGRLYSEIIVPQEEKPTPCPRDQALHSGPTSAAEFTDNFLCANSQAESPLTPLDKYRPSLTWRPVIADKTNLPTVLTAQNTWSDKPNPAYAYLLEFTVQEEKKQCVLNCSYEKNLARVYLNGKKIHLVPGEAFDVQKGVNRIILVYEDYRTYFIKKCELSITDTNGQSVEFSAVKQK